MIILSGIIYFVIVFLMLMGWKYRKPGIFAWRTGCAVAILGVIYKIDRTIAVFI